MHIDSVHEKRKDFKYAPCPDETPDPDNPDQHNQTSDILLEKSEKLKTFRQVDGKKSAGPDGVPPKLVKLCAMLQEFIPRYSTNH